MKVTRKKRSTSKTAMIAYLNDHQGCNDLLTEETLHNIHGKIMSGEYKNLGQVAGYIEMMTGVVLESYISENGEN